MSDHTGGVLTGIFPEMIGLYKPASDIALSFVLIQNCWIKSYVNVYINHVDSTQTMKYILF
jgi:hypothetical protein